MLKIKDFVAEVKGANKFTAEFSWKLESKENNVLQLSYHLQISGKNYSFDSGVVQSEQSLYIQVSNLPAETDFTASVTVTDNHGNTASASAKFETGLKAYLGNFIAPAMDEVPNASVLTKKLIIKNQIKSARLYATALGLYEITINGKKAGDLFFAPFWTSYQKTLEYQIYDVKDLLSEGENIIEMTLGKGWFRGRFGYKGQSNHYGTESAGWLNLVIEYDDGSRYIFATDNTWESHNSYITDSEIYDGETVDFTRALDKKFPVKAVDWDFKTLVLQQNEPVRMIEEIKPVSVSVAPNGETVVDFGQNLTGLVRFIANGNSGDTVTIRYAEVLQDDGCLYTDNLRTAKATDTFVLSGDEQVLLPKFTFHGFRYAGIKGAEVCPEKIVALVLHSDIRRTGYLKTDNKSINKLLENIIWGQRGNFLDVPTDCPQRDERLGWTGDAHVFAGTAMLQYDVRRFFKKWLCDVRADQSPSGGVPNFVPDIQKDMYNVSVWSDALPMIVLTGYERYGDISFIKENFAAVCRYMDSLINNTDESGLIKKGFQYGDWLALDNDERQTKDYRGATDMYLVANAYYLQSLNATVKLAEYMGNQTKAKKYHSRYKRVQSAFRREYVTATGRMVSESQTALTLALKFGLMESRYIKSLGDRLKSEVEHYQYHLNTGFAGTPHIMFALSDSGAHDVATALLMKRSYPSWLYEVDMGATTVWERWDGILPNGKYHDPAMNSFNHYSYGAVAEFIYRRIAGLDVIEPGYKKFKLAPRLTVGLAHVRMEYESVYGTILCEYEIKGKVGKLKAEIPVNTTAEIHLPDDTKYNVGSGKYEYCFEIDEEIETNGIITSQTTIGDILDSKVYLDALNAVSGGLFNSKRLLDCSSLPLGIIAQMLGPDGKDKINGIINAANKILPNEKVIF